MKFFSEAVNYPAVKVVLGLFLLGLIAANAKTRKTAVQALIAFLLANTFTEVLKHAMPEHRPYQELTNVINWTGLASSYGTASAHSANMAAIAFVFVYHLQWWGTPWVAVAAIVGYSRVFCGAHYPHQVLLGWICGLVAGLAVTKGWEAIGRFRSKNTELGSQGTGKPET